MAHLKWLVVRDLDMIESATFWKDGPEIETGELRTEDIGTEVFFFPAASHVEKDGSFTQTQRMLQWHHKAVEPPGDARSELQLLLPPRPQDPRAAGRLHRSSGPAAARPDLGLPRRRARRPVRRGGAAGDQRRPPHRRQGRPAAVAATPRCGPTARPPAAAGSTPASTPTGSTRPPGASPARSSPGSPRSGAGRGRRTAGSSTTAPRPTPRASRGASARPTSGGTRSRARGPGTTSPTSRSTSRPSYRPTRGRRRPGGPGRRRPVHHAGRRQGLAVRARPGLLDGPLPAHYEPHESPVRQPALPPAGQPDPPGVPAHGQPVQPLAPASRAPRSSRTSSPPTG